MKPKFDTYLLDLDGTLVDSKKGIFNCIRYALDFFGLKENTSDEFLNNFIGPPLNNSFSKFYGFDKELCDRVLAKYRERYVEKGMYECSLYPFVVKNLIRLKEADKTLALATSKVEPYARQILKSFKIDCYFDEIQGADFAAKFCEKPDVVRLCLAKLNGDKGKTAMVGDRKYDILGAKENGIASVGVLYGYGGKSELSEYGADYIIDDLGALL